VALVGFVDDSSIAAATQGVRGRLGEPSLPRNRRKNARSAETVTRDCPDGHGSITADAGSEREIEHLLPLVQAIARRHVLAVDYAKPGRSPERRTIHPLHLAELDDGWLLLAQCPGRRDVRTFVLRRIHALQPTGATFPFPADFDAKAIVRGSLGRFT